MSKSRDTLPESHALAVVSMETQKQRQGQKQVCCSYEALTGGHAIIVIVSHGDGHGATNKRHAYIELLGVQATSRCYFAKYVLSDLDQVLAPRRELGGWETISVEARCLRDPVLFPTEGPLAKVPACSQLQSFDGAYGGNYFEILTSRGHQVAFLGFCGTGRLLRLPSTIYPRPFDVRLSI